MDVGTAMARELGSGQSWRALNVNVQRGHRQVPNRGGTGPLGEGCKAGRAVPRLLEESG